MRTLLAARRLALLAVPVLIFAALPARALLRCAIDGGVRTHCCCPERAPLHDATVASDAACCCSVATDHARPLPPSTTGAEAGSALPQPVAFVTVALPEPRAAMHEGRPLASAARALGPPLLLLKSSLLI